MRYFQQKHFTTTITQLNHRIASQSLIDEIFYQKEAKELQQIKL